MSELQFIVDALNKPPFNAGLSLVTFDEKSPFELLETLQMVLVYLDNTTHDVDIRDEPRDSTCSRIMQFLHLLKYKFPPGRIEEFKQCVMKSNRNVIYPMLSWMLQRLAPLKKRAYLARFLINVEVPSEFFQDEEIKAKEISQLEEERQQLKDKISRNQRKMQSKEGFQELLDVTSALRREQEEETKLHERMQEQEHLLSKAEAEYMYVLIFFKFVFFFVRNFVPNDFFNGNFKNFVAESRALVKETLPRQMAQQTEKLRRLQNVMSEQPRSEEDVRHLEAECMSTEQDISELRRQISNQQAKLGDDKLGIFRQQAALVERKLKTKEKECEDAEVEAAELQTKLQDKEAILSELTGPKFMKREEFKKYATELRSKTNKYKKLKKEIAVIAAETVTLDRTEQLLRSRDENVQELLAKIEKEKGLKSATDQVKGKTLEEISKIVSDINSSLKKRKVQLQPQIKKLRAVRKGFRELEQVYLQKKATYDNTAVGLESSRLKLEKQCAILQEETVQEESRYHHLQCLIAVASFRMERVKQEEKFAKGNGKLLRDFKNYTELYNHKLSSQASMSKELHKRQKEIKENALGNMKQKGMFEDLRKLLEAKKQIALDQKNESKKDDVDDDIDMLTNMGTIVDGANVMTIE
eukprot:GSMAST32.ASY1.ANO1.188.1 assembled CDS